MPPAAPRRLVTCSAFLLTAFASGCRWGVEVDTPLRASTDAASAMLRATPGTAATAPADNGWYPLATGNSWRLRGNTTLRMVKPGQPTEILSNSDFELTFDLLCQEGGYIVERKRERFAGGNEASSYTRLRQDRDGLWQSAIPAGPPQCVGRPALATEHSARPNTMLRMPANPALRSAVTASLADLDRKLAGWGGITAIPARPSGEDPPPPGDLPRLRYPLRPGSEWIYQSFGSLSIVIAVEAHETLDTPVGRLPAWRVRLDRPGIFKPGRDRSHIWYGRAGYLQLVTHLESDVIVDGVVIGYIESDHTHYVESIQLSEPGRFAPVNR